MKLTSELCSLLPWQKQRIWGSVNTMSCHMHFMWYSMGKVVCQMEMIVTYAQTQQLLFWKLGLWNWKGTVLREAANEWSPQGRALYQDSCVFLVFLFIWTALALSYAITSQVKPWSKLIPSRKCKESKAVDGMPVCFLQRGKGRVSYTNLQSKCHISVFWGVIASTEGKLIKLRGQNSLSDM